MSAGISPSGVASLRAKFESKDESTSPPSRGRSPAASLSVTGDDSRPISKIRTSFVAVGPRGQMGDFNASKELGSKGDRRNGDWAEDSAMDGAMEKSDTNDFEFTPQKSKKEENTSKQTTPKSSPQEASTPQEKPKIMDSEPLAASPNQPISNAEDNPDTTLPSDPKEVAAVSSGAALEGAASPLGSILKGSPFEQGENKIKESNMQGIGAAAEPTQASEEQANHFNIPVYDESVKEAYQNKLQESVFRRTPSPENTATSSEQRLSKNVSPRSAVSKEPIKERLKDARKTTVQRASRPPVAPKAPAAASKPAPRLGKKPGSSSPPSFTKPRPKSPTRPVRLPGSATAPTAASAARVEVAPAATAKPKDRTLSNPPSLRQHSPRTSLPAGSKPREKAKDKPKSRLSTVSSKASEGSFLNRMMRPTQSSSQKTHEKVEPKTPPKKTNEVRPKRKSDGAEKAKRETVEAKGEQPAESSPSPAVQAAADSSEAASTNASNGIEENASASATPVPSE